MSAQPYRIKAVLFDFDGTLTRPGEIDFKKIRCLIGCPAGVPILEHIDALASPEQKQAAHSILNRFEMDAAQAARPNRDAEAVVLYLKSRGLPIGILSRNSRAAIHRAFENFQRIGPSDFDFIGSRELPVKIKPNPDGILYAANKLDVPVTQMLVVGDFIFDIQAGAAAGAMTVFLSNGGDTAPMDVESDHVISRLDQLRDIVRLGLPLPAGKLPNDLLARFISTPSPPVPRDPSLLIGPGVGEDSAAVASDGAEILVLTSDPITFVSDALGHYAILINANDIATAGAVPRWFLATVLLPCGVTASAARSILHEIQSACRRWKITLCGGHTEITDAVNRPVVSGTLVGTVARGRLVDKRRMAPGDRVLLTKAVAVEGTAIVAREFAQRLRGLGMPAADIAAAGELVDQIGVLDEARLAAETAGVHAMHDVTEGGLATAVAELSEAGGRRIRIQMDQVPVFPETRALCRYLDLNPMGLIGSGSLLICCAARATETLMARLQGAGIPVACIGEITENGPGVDGFRHGQAVPWPRFDRDELARLYARGPTGPMA